ncbi:uncharacterized protein LTR77_006405 [Saxophila tyrrhenica]|uniref:CWF19-like protein 1 n=1 Tax=Saxophila tyrrhenica TaxID=1690608 RepID=A0AAV9P7S9_9PEZI|nr:hypothetical protein LTR77_006405 [Saxophila tyrrhenica]
MPHKIVVTGDVNGRIDEVFGKIKTLHAKQGFAFAIIAGDLFSSPEAELADQGAQVTKLISGEIEVPLPTYFSLGTHALPSNVVEKLEKDDGELCSNLYVLGRKGSLKTADGFRVVAVGGKHSSSEDASIRPYDAVYKDADAKSLAESQSDAELLITNDWPAAIRDGAKAFYNGTEDPPQGIQSIAELCAAVKPRYHFSASSAFYERDPFFHPDEGPKPITRFISLAPFGNPEKSKWIYAFSLEPSSEPPSTLPAGTTASPFLPKKRKLDSQQDSFNSFRYANGHGGDHRQQNYRGNKRHKQQQRAPPPGPEDCFFCLASKNVEDHMIGSLGDESYVAIAKGPLSTRSTYPELGFPGHLIIIPHVHQSTFAAIETADTKDPTPHGEREAAKAAAKESRTKVESEMSRYRSALHQLLTTKSTEPKLGAVTWCISRAANIHLHYQFLPVPATTITRGLVQAAFNVEAENNNYPKFAKSPSDIAEAERGDHLKVMVWSEVGEKTMVLPVDGSFRFDLQYPRKVMAKLLGLEGRMDWRACAQSKEEETADAEAFKEAFKDFDFTM